MQEQEHRLFANETTIDDNSTLQSADEAGAESLQDLPVNQEQEGEVKGGIGLLLPAVQKAR